MTEEEQKNRLNANNSNSDNDTTTTAATTEATAATTEATKGTEKATTTSKQKQQLSQYFDVSVADFLTEMKLWDKDRKVVILNSSIEPRAGFQTLLDHHIRSAPVRDHDSFIGFLDIRDLVSFVIFAVKESQRQHYQNEDTQLTVVQERPPAKEIAIHVTAEVNGDSANVAVEVSQEEVKPVECEEKHHHHHHTHDMQPPQPKNPEYALELSLNRIMAEDGFFRPRTEQSHIGDIEPARMYENPMQAITTSYLCRRNRFMSVHPEDKLLTVLQLLSTRDLHRVAVLDKAGSMVGIISQSNLIHYLERHVKDAPEDFTHSIDELKMGHSPVFSALSTAPALAAFELIDKKQISGLAMIDVEGSLIGNISATDLKLLLKHPDLRILTRTLRDFLSTVRQLDPHTKVPAATVPPDASLGKVIAKFAATKMHRLYVTSDSHKPILNISLTDVLSALLSTFH